MCGLLVVDLMDALGLIVELLVEGWLYEDLWRKLLTQSILEELALKFGGAPLVKKFAFFHDRLGFFWVRMIYTVFEMGSGESEQKDLSFFKASSYLHAR